LVIAYTVLMQSISVYITTIAW